MKALPWSVLSLILIVIGVTNVYAFHDKVHKYSITFPKGWKIEKLNDDFLEASSGSGTHITVGAVREDMPAGNFTNEFAEYYTSRVTVRRLQPYCQSLSVLSAYAGDFNGYDAVVSTLKCDNDFVNTMFVPHNGTTYYIALVYKQSDTKGYNLMTSSIKSFKILK